MVRVQVPATTANLGPGFDCLGMALELHNYVTLELQDTLAIEVLGEGQAELLLNEENLAFRAVRLLYQSIGQEVPPLRLVLENHIPLARGLGSSAAAVVGALVGANELAAAGLSPYELIRLAHSLEGHLDNAAAAVLGGMVLCLLEDGKLVCTSIPVPERLRAVIFIPQFQMSTQEARAVLPRYLSREDAVHNAARVGLLVASLMSGRLELLAAATQDRLHQPYRQELFPAMPELFLAATQAGALAAFLSGAGSAVLALAEGETLAIEEAMTQKARSLGLAGRTLVTGVSPWGARVISAGGREGA